MLIFGSSRSQMFFKIDVLKNFAIFTGKHLYLSLYHNKMVGPLLKSTCRGYFWIFVTANTFFSAEFGIYCWQSQRFLFRTPLKTRAKPHKQLLELSCNKRCSLKFWNFHRKTPVLKKGLQHRCFPVEFTKFLRTPNLKSANDCLWNLLFHVECPF